MESSSDPTITNATTPAQRAFESSTMAQVEAETAWLRLLLRRLLDPVGGDTKTINPPLGASMQELLAFLKGAPSPHPLDDEIIETRRLIDERFSDSPIPWNLVCRRLDVAGAVKRLLSILFVVAVDPTAARAVTLAHDDPSGRPPDLGFYLRLLRPDEAELCAIRQALSPGSPLREYLVVLLGPPSVDGRPGNEFGLLSRQPRLAAGVVAMCLDDGCLDEWLSGICEWERPEADFSGLFLPEDLKRDLETMAGDLERLRLALYGPRGMGKREVAAALAYLMGKPLLYCNASTVGEEDVLRVVLREAWLHDALLYLDCSSSVEPPGPWVGSFGRLVNSLPVAVVIGAQERVVWEEMFPQSTVTRTIPITDRQGRLAAWQRAMAGNRLADDVSLEIVAGLFTMTPGQIRKAAMMARHAAARRNPIAGKVSQHDLLVACDRLVTTRLSVLGQRIPPGFRWDDLVLPDDTLQMLREFVAMAKTRTVLYEEWGFARKMPYGRGVSAMFYGPPGTGKTMVASVIASELGMHLYRIDLSQVVNKFVGETEKNLARIFDEAGDSGHVLLFDEADALFTRRTEVHTSVDRYANLEVNYLLQRMEEYEGVTILTTNFFEAIDEAFKRRIHFKVRFPPPDREARKRLWQVLIPKEAPLATRIDFDALAEYELTGGYIRNAILRAAIAAAAERRPICESDLKQAATKVLKELGHLVRTD